MIIYFFISFSLALIIVIFYPQLILTYTAECEGEAIKTFNTQEKAQLYLNECNLKNNITYININNISFINGIK